MKKYVCKDCGLDYFEPEIVVIEDLKRDECASYLEVCPSCGSIHITMEETNEKDIDN